MHFKIQSEENQNVKTVKILGIQMAFVKSLQNAIFIIIIGYLPPFLAHSQEISLSAPSSSKSTFILGVPWYAYSNQIGARVEYEAFPSGGIGITYLNQGKKSVEVPGNTGDELEKRYDYAGAELAIDLSRYSNPNSLSGFFWTFSLGYKDLDLTAGYSSPSQHASMANTGYLVGNDGLLSFEQKLKGPTGAFKLGYRHCFDALGFMIGAHAGGQYFDLEVEDKATNDIGTLSNEEKDKIKSYFQTTTFAALEIAFVI